MYRWLLTLFLHTIVGFSSQISYSNNLIDLNSLKGFNIVNSKETRLNLISKKAVVVIFLSAVCPCSNSHIQELTSLAKEYTDFEFIGIHSNVDESKEITVKYFEKAKLPFVVIQDNNAKIADEFKAYKTPHAFVIHPDGNIVYRGGVSDSHDFPSSKKRFLRDAIFDISQNNPVRTSEGRTLGCVISRGEKNVW